MRDFLCEMDIPFYEEIKKIQEIFIGNIKLILQQDKVIMKSKKCYGEVILSKNGTSIQKTDDENHANLKLLLAKQKHLMTCSYRHTVKTYIVNDHKDAQSEYEWIM